MPEIDLPSIDMTRKKQTFFLSAEFLITMIVQTGVFIAIGTTVINRVEARVAALEDQQVTPERAARIEEKLITIIENQGTLRLDVRELRQKIEASNAK